MLHPHTELKFVSPEIGYGIYATALIPKGTITWVKDQLDRTISKDAITHYSEANLENLMKYTYRDSVGDYVFCWDLTRYVNHSYQPNSMLTALGFEIAIRDIHPGDEMTNDYGTLNIIEPFECASGPIKDRTLVKPDDLSRYYLEWDKEIERAFEFIPKLDQPLKKFLTKIQIDKIDLIHKGQEKMPSVLTNLFREGHSAP